MIHPSIHTLLQRYCPDLTDLGSYVNGQWVTGQGEPIEVLSAHDETVLFAYADADASLVPLLNAATKVAQAQLGRFNRRRARASDVPGGGRAAPRGRTPGLD